jgi:hypothetical protein
MRSLSAQKFTVVAGSLLLCSMVAGLVGATNAPGAVPGEQTETVISVNRAVKGDRLPTALIQLAQPRLLPSTEGSKPVLKRPPLGCDPAFSPVADPARGGIYKRCTV